MLFFRVAPALGPGTFPVRVITQSLLLTTCRQTVCCQGRFNIVAGWLWGSLRVPPTLITHYITVLKTFIWLGRLNHSKPQRQTELKSLIFISEWLLLWCSPPQHITTISGFQILLALDWRRRRWSPRAHDQCMHFYNWVMVHEG